MTELNQAYQTLELDLKATKEEVEARYDFLLKKERSKIKRGESTLNSPEFAIITQAYRTILAHDLKTYTEKFEKDEYSKYKGMANKVKKIDHFWSYYKWHTITTIIILAVIVYSIVGFVERQEQKRYEASLPPIELHVSFLGNYIETQATDGMELTETRIHQDFPHVPRVKSDIIFVPSDPSMQAAYLQKAMVMISTENPDVYLVDEAMLQWGANGGIFAVLDQYEQFSHLVDTEYGKKHTHLETGVESTVALDLTNTSLAKDLNVSHLNLYAAIRVNAPHYDNALKFLEKYATELTP